MPSIGEEHGVIVKDLLERRVTFADLTHLAPGRRDSAQAVIVAGEDDDVVAIPRRPANLAAKRGQRLRRRARDVDLLQISIRGEDEVSAVGRPGRRHGLRHGILGTGQQPRGGGIELANPDAVAAARRRRGKRDAAAVRRYRDVAEEAHLRDGYLEVHFRRRRRHRPTVVRRATRNCCSANDGGSPRRAFPPRPRARWCGARDFRTRRQGIVDFQTSRIDAGQALACILHQTPAQQTMNRRRNGSRHGAEVDIPLEHACEDIGHVVSSECAPAGQHLVKHATERPHVRALVDDLAARLLRTHVRRRYPG